ncbi:WD40 repeat-like protein [Metschnikowia bicuspidata]|uniref:Peroxin-7 n=1 Tax=Metschnikowia bicuspidata TaxID=27322 RepID=A0A4P9ZFE3_9ASCO|nr:WD40 repeat-like protein [Metschnikowia bicuspidata]
MRSFRTHGYNGYGVRYSPFFDNKLAVATAANYGLVGNGKLFVLGIDDAGTIHQEAAWETQDGLFDVAWSEIHENQVVVASGDGSVKLFDLKVGQFPVMNFREHQREVFSVNWNLVDKATFVTLSWDGTIKVWSPSRQVSLLTLSPGPTASLPAVDGANVAHAPMSHKGSTQPAASTNCIYSASFSPQSLLIIVSCEGSSRVNVWDIRAPKSLQLDFVAHGGLECLSCDWNKYRPTVIATGATDKSVRVWDLRMIALIRPPTPSLILPPHHTRGPTPLNEFWGHDFAVRRVAWSPHCAKEVMSVSYDMTARVWVDQSDDRARLLKDGASGCRGVTRSHREFVIGCDYSLWGEPGWAATTGWDEMVYVWDSKRMLH